MHPEVEVRVIEIAAKWSEEVDTRGGPYANKKKWEVFDEIYKAISKTVRGVA